MTGTEAVGPRGLRRQVGEQVQVDQPHDQQVLRIERIPIAVESGRIGQRRRGQGVHKDIKVAPKPTVQPPNRPEPKKVPP